jgi:hypothetical protein
MVKVIPETHRAHFFVFIVKKNNKKILLVFSSKRARLMQATLYSITNTFFKSTMLSVSLN